MSAISSIATAQEALTAEQVAEVVSQACPAKEYRGKRVLLIVPDGTRTAPVGLMFQTVFAQLGGVTAALDVMIALGTHQPMSEAAIGGRLEITPEERAGTRNQFPCRDGKGRLSPSRARPTVRPCKFSFAFRTRRPSGKRSAS